MQVRGVGVSYSSADGNSVAALDHIDLEVRAGEVLGILGESGCGKSTLAHTLLRLLPPHAKVETGEIFFQARDLLRLSESELSKIRGRYIALVPQDPVLALNPVMTAGNQIAEVLRAHLPLTPRERKEAVRNLLRSVGFDRPDGIYDAYPNQLSGGQCQRVSRAFRKDRAARKKATQELRRFVLADRDDSDLHSRVRATYSVGETAWLTIRDTCVS